ncbi:hypothetical protein BKA58DRAFT_417027 [Alternaria rosae]|uniref:uncharacterized protein n=1 Tax=Alternaria rosae TaxID=1187941 RepID=UPI001E8E85C8|nr:uncharacterized protein BKA58DRAFT_417027 [Alternaria rosae]KAH6883218.1 hypothetical protein BKA58DRAFT_417027 [Alternaria rosae]
MSLPTASPPSPQAKPPQGEDRSQDQLESKDSPQVEGSNSEITQPAQPQTGREQFNAMMRSMKSHPDGHCIGSIGTDGVYREIHYLPGPPDQISDYEIYDAKPMSPEMIKAWLDTRPWKQETEDKYRDADGRTVPQEQWWNPPPGMLFPMRSKNERDEEMRVYREERKAKEEKIARGEIEAEVPVACNSIKSDYDLSPR